MEGVYCAVRIGCLNTASSLSVVFNWSKAQTLDPYIIIIIINITIIIIIIIIIYGN